MRIRFSQELPRYVQVKQWVERQIASGYWKPGSVLPPERELAEQLGISPLTVSRALQWLARDGVLVRKRRVGTVVAQTIPNSLFHQNLTLMVLGTRSGTRQGADFYFSTLQHSILSSLAHEGLRTLWLDYQFEQVERELYSSDFVGILAIAPTAEHLPFLEDLYRRGVPVLIVGANSAEWDIPTVDTDNYHAACEGVRYLLSKGHQRFVGLFGALETFNSRDRWRGFRDTLQSAGIPSEQVWTFVVPYADEVEDAVREGLLTALRLPNGPTAIFAGGYYLALSALQTVLSAGYRVPEQVSILGFDDPPSAALSTPPLTTFRQPLTQLGERAVQNLLAMIRGQMPEPKHQFLPLELVVRQTVGEVIPSERVPAQSP
ncbi:MAG: LacI family DNA-binding transcriptional regulator [Fimbriimonadales bacterium]